jgi:hydrogenase-4 membrane subunit HyfE
LLFLLFFSKAREAQRKWAQTTFEQRREVLRLMNDYIVANQELLTAGRRDTGKTMVDGSNPAHLPFFFQPIFVCLTQRRKQRSFIAFCLIEDATPNIFLFLPLLIILLKSEI